MKRKTNRHYSRISALLTTILMSAPFAASAATHVDINSAAVNPTGNSWAEAFPNLQDALECVRSSGCDQELWVAQGVYKPHIGAAQSGDETDTFIIDPGMRLYGGFNGTELVRSDRNILANKTILSGDLDGDDIDTNMNGVISVTSNIVGTNTNQIVKLDAQNLGPYDQTTVLNGFFITAADNPSIGGGLMCSGSAVNACSPAIKNVFFRGNRATIGGALYSTYGNAVLHNVEFSGNEATALPGWGAAIYTYSSDLTIDELTCKNNTADYGGCMYNNESSPVITKARFAYNEAVGYHGGAVFNEDSFLTLTNATFLDNTSVGWGGGMFNVNSSNELLDVAFLGNTASDGGAIANEARSNYQGSSLLRNVIFSGNEAIGIYGGGAIYNWNTTGWDLDITIENGSFSHNTALGGDGGAIYNDGSAVFGGGIVMNLNNTILWDSSDSGGANEIFVQSATVNASFSDLQGGPGAVSTGATGVFNDLAGNVDVDPLFIDADGADNIFGTQDDNLHLALGVFFGNLPSPVIDLGDNGLVSTDFDFDGNARIIDGDSDGVATVDMGAYEAIVLQIPGGFEPPVLGGPVIDPVFP